MRRIDDSHRLEEQLKCKLHGSWAALLVLSSNRAQSLIQHLGRLAKCGITKIRIHKTEIGMIQNVECFRPKLQPQSFLDWEFPPNRQIDLRFAETADEIPGGGTARAGAQD